MLIARQWFMPVVGQSTDIALTHSDWKWRAIILKKLPCRLSHRAKFVARWRGKAQSRSNGESHTMRRRGESRGPDLRLAGGEKTLDSGFHRSDVNG